jgi:general secretion pathway protein M
MIKLDREQTIAIGVLAALLLICVLALELSFQMRSTASLELSERREQLSRLEARAKARNDARARAGAIAPTEAFLDAPTPGLAAARLQAHIVQVADIHHCIITTSGIEPTKHDDAADLIRLQVVLEASWQSLQTFLYQLESGTPYVFVEQIAVQLTGVASQRAADDPLLRVTLGLRSVWRRGTA